MPVDPHPQFCRLEYLGASGWETGHQGVNLLYPERYVERLQAHGKIGRVTIVDTGEVFTGTLPPPCGICSEVHAGPEGGCLI